VESQANFKVLGRDGMGGGSRCGVEQAVLTYIFFRVVDRV
jgi:hypothetical protein